MTDVISTVSKQWAARPDDQRYLSVAELHKALLARRSASRMTDMALEHLQVRPTESGALMLASEAGPLGALTHWSFGQLCQRAHAPAGFLRGLPAELAAVNLQWQIDNGAIDEGETDGKVLTWAHKRTPEVACVTGPNYGRIWDADITGQILKRINLEEWKVPAASYAAHDPKRASTLYASDRDVFIFLVNESRTIEVDNRQLYRGFYVYNSETYNGTAGIATFFYEYVCDNRNIWGPADFREITVRHTSGGPHRWMHDVVPQLNAYAQASDRPMIEAVKAASRKEVGKDKKSVVEWLKTRGFGIKLAGDAYDAAERDNRNPRSVWGIVSGLTDLAHDIKHTDARVDLERKAGALLDTVAVAA